MELLTTKFGIVIQKYIEISSPALTYQAFPLNVHF
jgi:hypothetical protein